MIWLLMAVAGGLGTVLRVVISSAVSHRYGAPRGTIVVNIVGAAALAVLVGTADADTLFVVGVGFLGGFTTFSTWMLDAVLLAASGEPRDAFRHIARVSTLAAVVAVVGMAISGAL